MKGLTLWMLLAASAASGEPSPPVTHYEAVTASPQTSASGPSAELAMGSDGHDRLTVPVRLGASRAYHFLVDTGSDRTSVSRQLARELGLQERASAELHSATGSSEVRMAHLPELRMSRRAVRNISAPMLDADDMGADGILGIDSLRSQRVVFDFAGGRLSVLSADAPDEMGEGAIVVRAKRLEGRLVITDAEVDGVRVRVVLDTGSSLTIGNAALRRKLERRRAPASAGTIELISVTGAVLHGEMVTVGGLEIGGARLEGLNVVFADAHTFRQLKLDRTPALLLGMNALRGFDQVSIDFASRTLSLVLPRERKRNGV
jgi:predicted aspartyl protease